MNETIHFVILAPNKKLLDEVAVTELYFPAAYGVVGIFPGHAPMVTEVGTGLVVYTQKNVSGYLKVAGGVAEISGNTVTLMVDVGEEAANIDLERARRSLERAQSRLAAKEMGNVDVKRAQRAKERAEARVKTAELHQKRVVKPPFQIPIPIKFLVHRSH